MLQHRSVRGGSWVGVALLGLGFGIVACAPPAKDSGGSDGRGGAPAGTGGRGGSGSGQGGGSGGAGSDGSQSGGSSGSQSGGSSGSQSGGSGGAGSGGSQSGGSAGGGGSQSGRGGSGGASSDGGGAETSSDAGGAPTFTKVYTEILVPGCTGPNNACHSVVRDTYYHFAAGMQARSYMLLVGNAPPAVGTIPTRVNTLLNYVTPQMAGGAPRMPPQSGPNLGNPPTVRPPLTPAQIALIRTWATSGAKND